MTRAFNPKWTCNSENCTKKLYNFYLPNLLRDFVDLIDRPNRAIQKNKFLCKR